MATIKQIDGRTIHQIQSGQVIVDLCSVVKELVENSVDAGASTIDVRFKNQGLDLIDVQDNGSGISPDNYASVALKHHTSKLSSYADIGSLETFGFRGEALASLCALSTITVTTCLPEDAPKGTKLTFEGSGRLNGTSVVAAQKGTTVSVEKLFHNLPVRRRELERNIKREWQKVITLLNQYACILTNTKFTVSQQPTKGKRIILFSTKGNPTTRENIINIFGAKTMSALVPLELELEMQPSNPNPALLLVDQSTVSRKVRIIGHVSRPAHGDGRQTPDRQMFFVNGRPCGLPQFAKAFNEVYKSYNTTQSPFLLADIQLDTHLYDVNVSPDKRTILLHDQQNLLDSVRASLTQTFDTDDYSVPTAQLVSSKPAPTARETSSKMAQGPIQDRKTNATPVSGQGSPSNEAEPFGDASSRLSSYSFVKPPVSAQISEQQASEAHGLIQRWVQRNSSIEEFHSDSNPPEENGSTKRGQGELDTDDDVQASSDLSYEEISEKSLHSSPRQLRQADLESARNLTDIPSSNSFRAVATMRHVSESTASSPAGVDPSGQSPSGIPSITQLRASSAGDILFAQRSSVKHADRSGSVIIGKPGIASSHRKPQDVRPDISNDLRESVAATIEDVSDDSSLLSGQSSPREVTSRTDDLVSKPESTKQILKPALLVPKNTPIRRVLTEMEASGPGKRENSTYQDESEAKSSSEASNSSKSGSEASSAAEQHVPMSGVTRSQTHRNHTDLGRRNPTLSLVQDLAVDEDRVRQRVMMLRQYITNDMGLSSSDMEVDDISAEDAESKLTLIISKSDFEKMRIIGQFNLGFIIAVRPSDDDEGRGKDQCGDDELFIIDQHASDEKYNFERLQSTTVVQSQRLVNPKRLELTALEEEVMMQNTVAIESNGFKVDIDTDGEWPVGSRCLLTALPLSRETTFNITDLEELISLLGDESSESNHIPRPSKVRKMFAMRACRSSVMIGKALTKGQMGKLVGHMGELDKPWNCPHGRPTMRHLCRMQIWDSKGWTGDLNEEGSLSLWAAYAEHHV